MSTTSKWIQKYWFRGALILMIAYAFFMKDFSFSINMGSPVVIEKTQSGNISKPLKTAVNPGKENQELRLIGPGNIANGNVKKELAQIEPEVIAAYLKRFAHVAISERKKYGIPSSIILANALLHSAAGKRVLAANGNNHFALPCSAGWSGDTQRQNNHCYRKYDNAWLSFRDHSLYLNSGKFRQLRALGTTDYTAWANGLEKLAFTNEPQLAHSLIHLIESYELYRLDTR